jgi:hypothetical protein
MLMGSQRVVDAAASIDRSLAEVKGRAFVEKLRDGLPKIPDIGDHVIQTKQVDSSPEAVKKICEPLTPFMTEYADEEWVMKARFQYCDLSTAGGFNHKYETSLKLSISGVYCFAISHFN